MKKKTVICGIMAGVVTASVTLGGCSAMLSTNNTKDLQQIVAKVDISKSAEFKDEHLDAYTSAVGETEITKRELITYFLTTGYTLINNYGYTYEQAFNTLLDGLVNTAVLTQYSTMCVLQYKAGGESATEAKINEVLAAYANSAKDAATPLDASIAKYEWLLDDKDVELAKYTLYSSINSAIDSYERSYVDEEEEDVRGSETRTTPTDVSTQIEDYYPKTTDGKLDYAIYTGYAGYELTKSGAYQDDKVEGTSPATRRRAYNSFVSGFDSYDIIDVETEDVKDVLNLRYIKEEYAKQLANGVVNKYYDIYEDQKEEKLTKDGYQYVKDSYDELLASQKDNYTASGFTSTMDGMSDTSFVLYTPEVDDAKDGAAYGFVYNILLPFSEAQNAKLSELKTKYADSDTVSGYKPEYYVERNKILQTVTTTDQRAAWFNGATEYAFDASEHSDVKKFGASNYLFFEDALTEPDKFEKIDKYYGAYSYNGTVMESDDGYILQPNKLKIDDMLKEFSDYIDVVLGTSKSVNIRKNDSYYNTTEFYYPENSADYDKKNPTKINYEHFVYASGEVICLNGADKQGLHANIFDKDSDQYKVLSAVNELQYAYTTDTGVLSNYLGYSVDIGDTSYIKEFEYAAHEAISRGAGAFSVCAGDYGWHLIYVTYTFDPNSETFNPEWTKDRIETEGTFENLFYEWVKSTVIPNLSTKRRTEILTQYSVDETVTRFEKTYEDLLQTGNN